MLKTWLIIQREYLTRVRKKSFLVTTFLIPIAMVAISSIMIFMAVKSEQKQRIAVIDETGVFTNKLDTTSSSYEIKYIAKSNDEKHTVLEKNESDILLHIYPIHNGVPDSIHIYKDGGVSLNAKQFLNSEVNNVFQMKQMQDAGINKEKIDSITELSLDVKSFDLQSNKETNTEISTVIGYAMGFLIYLVILIYGMGVMRGVSEEKTNRIAEVIISSVKPFQLMMGKIVGIALVGLTQFILWLVLTGVLHSFLPFLIPGLGLSSSVGMSTAEMQQAQSASASQLAPMLQMLYSQNWILLIGCFLFYFLGGYFIYAAMFAAVGSLVNEDPQEAQQMTLPVTMPIIIAFFIMMTATRDPNSTLAVFGSMFPLTSPIVMMARIPYGIPGWQIALSMLFLVLGFIGMTWLGAKIYRTGILMYGKKVTWKEVYKWIRYS
ncbi:MAG: ABC transporter permease [Bacteroidetes bacterium]|nr:ABC transporter permease [Bacteroidota bacterium]